MSSPQAPQSSQSLPPAVDALLQAAFGGEDEARLVRRLRADKALATELIYRGEDGLQAYAALSHMVAPQGWVCLAPVAVRPALQGRGLGGKLVELALKWAADRGHTVVVLGDPAYYGARGFSLARAVRLHSPYPIDHTLLAGPGEDAPDHTLVYPDAFNG